VFKLIIFDFDGPILDSLKRSKNSVLQGRKLLIKKGVPLKRVRITKETFIKYWGYPGYRTSELMFPDLTKEELRVITDCWVRNELKRKIPLVRGTLKTLRYLRKRKKVIALLTARSRNLSFHFKNYPLENLFDIIQSWRPSVRQSEIERVHNNHIFCNYHKPNPNVLNPILKWAARKGISKKEMILIDDTLVGLETASRTKIAFLGACTGPIDSKNKWKRYGNLNGKYVINSIAELPKWLEKCAGT